MKELTEKFLIDFLDDYITFLEFVEEPEKFKKKYNLWHKQGVDNDRFKDPGGASTIMDGLDITGILEFYFHAKHYHLRFLTMSLYGKRLKLHEANEREKEFISKQIEFLSEIRAKEEKRAETKHNEKLTRGLQELEDIKFREEECGIAKLKQEKLVAKKEEETSIAIRLLYKFLSQAPSTYPGVAFLLTSVIPLIYLFGPLGLILYIFFGPVGMHAIDTVIHVRNEGKERQKTADEGYWVPIKEKPKPKTYDEHIKEEDDELTRQIEALPQSTE